MNFLKKYGAEIFFYVILITITIWMGKNIYEARKENFKKEYQNYKNSSYHEELKKTNKLIFDQLIYQ